jgi:isopenicillin N synthase-like dioxygenase
MREVMVEEEFETLPLVDIAAFSRSPARRGEAMQRLQHALENSGFLYAHGLGLLSSQLQAAFDSARHFFSLPAAIKSNYAYTDIAANFGYQGVEQERLDPGSHPDLKESFTMRNALAVRRQTQRWPDDAFRRSALSLYESGLAAAFRILEIMAACLQLPSQYFVERHTGENVTLRFLHYPANLPRRDTLQLGAGAHTDYGSITLLFQDDVGGLEVRDAQGRWRHALPVPGSAVVNTGDLMERWTNGRFRSTLHRVRPIAGTADRYSIALFVDPDAAVAIDCIETCVSSANPRRYPQTTAGEHIRRKIAATHGKVT